MIPAQMDVPTWRNADYAEEFACQTDGVPLDLTGLTIIMQIRRYATAPTILLNAAVSIANPVSGLFQVSITRQQLIDIYYTVLPSSIANQILSLVYDIIIVHADNFREIWCQGVLTINPGVNVNG